MEPATTPDLRYPIGRFKFPDSVTAEEREELITAIEAAPDGLRRAVSDLDDVQLSTPYRPGGWTVRQLVHHVPDSHMNAYVRFRLALTEDQPTIKPYAEDRWAQLADATAAPVADSLDLLDALHRRWTALLRSMSDVDFARTFRHPDLGLVRLDRNLALYAWHGRHHIAHATALRERMGWR
jgi:uncharacterized damage-inducible protein DinB